MAVALAYDAQLSRVRIDATGLSAAPTATVERSTDQIRWATVRGGVDVPVAAGVLATVDDYEFSADTLCYYRVSYKANMSFVAAGTAAHAVNTSVAPGVPAGHAAEDLFLMLVAIRNSGAGTPNTPAGWTLLINGSNMALFGKTAAASESAPTVTFAGGVANADTSAQIAAFRGVQASPVSVGVNLNVSAQDIAINGIDLPFAVDGAMVLHIGWKQDDWTSVAVVASGTEIGEPDTTTGDDQGIVWDYRLITPGSFTFATVAARTFVVTGGAAAISRGGVAVFEPVMSTQTNSITPSLAGETWLKFLHRPFLNTVVEPYGELNVTRRSRSGTFDVVGRSYPVSVTDLKGSRQFDLQLKTLTTEDHDRLDLVLSGGDPVFLHAPPTSPLPTLYADIGDVSDESPVPGTHFFKLPLTEVVAPGADIVGATSTYQTIVNNYVSYSEVLSEFADYQEVLEEVGQPSDIVVP